MTQPIQNRTRKALVALSILIVGGCVFKTQATDIAKKENSREFKNACVFIKYTPEGGLPVFPVIPVDNQHTGNDTTLSLLLEPEEHRDIVVKLIKQITGADVSEDWIDGYLVDECDE